MVRYKTTRLPVESYCSGSYPQTSSLYSYVHQRWRGSVPPMQAGEGGQGTRTTAAEVAARGGAEARSCPPPQLWELLPPAQPATEETRGVWAEPTNQAKARCAPSVTAAPEAAAEHQLRATNHLNIKYDSTGATRLQTETRNGHGWPGPGSGRLRVRHRHGRAALAPAASAGASPLPLLGAG